MHVIYGVDDGSTMLPTCIVYAFDSLTDINLGNFKRNKAIVT